MKRSTKIILLSAAGLLALGIVLSAAGLFLGARPLQMIKNGLWDYTLYEEKPQNTFSKDNRYTLSPSGIHEISIDWIDGSVSVEPYDGTEILIEESTADPAGIDEKTALSYRIEQGELKIHEGRSIAAISFSSKDNLVKDLKVRLPYALAEQLAELEISGVDANFFLKDLTLGSLSADTVDGNLTATGLSLSELEMETVDGNLSAALRNCPAEISIDSTDGNAELFLPPGSGFTVSLDGLSMQQLHSDFPLRRIEEDEYGTESGSGNGEFEMDTVDGRLLIKENR